MHFSASKVDVPMTFMAEKGWDGCFQEQDCLSYRFQARITNSTHTGLFVMAIK